MFLAFLYMLKNISGLCGNKGPLEDNPCHPCHESTYESKKKLSNFLVTLSEEGGGGSGGGGGHEDNDQMTLSVAVFEL